MIQLRQANQTARCLIGHSEGFSLTAYPDGVGIWTIGWGTTRINGQPVTEGTTITEDQANDYFNHDISVFERDICDAVTVPLTDNQFGALVSLCYNIGSGNFRSSTLLRKLNDGDYDGAADEFSRWIYSAGHVLNGLVERRRKEKKLFLTPDDES